MPCSWRRLRSTMSGRARWAAPGRHSWSGSRTRPDTHIARWSGRIRSSRPTSGRPRPSRSSRAWPSGHDPPHAPRAVRRGHWTSCEPSPGCSHGRNRARTSQAGTGSAAPCAATSTSTVRRGWPACASCTWDGRSSPACWTTAEMSIAKADMQVARRYAGLAPTPESRKVWRRIRREYLLTRDCILTVNQRGRIMDALPVLQRLHRAAQPVRGLPVRAPGASAGALARPAARAPGARRPDAPRASHREWRRGRGPEHGLALRRRRVRLRPWAGLWLRASPRCRSYRRYFRPVAGHLVILHDDGAARGFRTTAAIREAPWGPRPIPSSRIPSHWSGKIPRSTSHSWRESSGS